jgi:cyanate lyase
MDNPYIPTLAKPAFDEFLKAEQAVDLAWQNVKDARGSKSIMIAMENFQDIQAESRKARALFHKCQRAVGYNEQGEE